MKTKYTRDEVAYALTEDPGVFGRETLWALIDSAQEFGMDFRPFKEELQKRWDDMQANLTLCR